MDLNMTGVSVEILDALGLLNCVDNRTKIIDILLKYRDNSYTCMVCGYNKLSDPPYHSHDICPSCGTHIGYSDSAWDRYDYYCRLHELRKEWIISGAKWWSDRDKPDNFDPIKQLKNIGYEVTNTEIKFIGHIE